MSGVDINTGSVEARVDVGVGVRADGEVVFFAGANVGLLAGGAEDFNTSVHISTGSSGGSTPGGYISFTPVTTAWTSERIK